jgi:hypothetical protein
MNDLWLEFIFGNLIVITFVIVSESFGSITQSIISYFLRKYDLVPINHTPTNLLVDNFFSNFFIGLVVWACFLMLTGLLGLTNLVFIYSSGFIVAIFNFIIFKRWSKLDQFLTTVFNRPWWILLSYFIVGLLVIIQSYNPILSFDGIWYHLSIPKMFLQNGNTFYAGEAFRYSVHPFLNFYWNLWPLALPISTLSAGLIINLIQAWVVIIGAIWTSIFVKEIFYPSKFLLTMIPFIVILSSTLSLSFYDWGMNDLYGMIFGSLALLSVGYLESLEDLDFRAISTSLIIIFGLFLLKIFFGISAFVIFLFLIYVIAKRLYTGNFKDLFKNRVFIKFILLSIFLAFIFVLPWIVRSFVFTGRLLDPLGTPGLSQDAFNTGGAVSRSNYWRFFLWDRLWNKHLYQILFILFSPFMAVGLFSVFNKKFRENHYLIWLFSLLTFSLVYILNYVGTLRYQLASTLVIVICGFVIWDYIIKSSQIQIELKILSAFVVILILLSNFIQTANKPIMLKTNNKHQYILELRDPDVIYYQTTSPLPNDLDTSENIYIAGFINRTAYIENPIFESRIQSELFTEVTTIEDFVNVLKSQEIRYILDKDESIQRWCEFAGVVDTDSCQGENQYWQVELVDAYSGVRWLKLN